MPLRLKKLWLLLLWPVCSTLKYLYGLEQFSGVMSHEWVAKLEFRLLSSWCLSKVTQLFESSLALTTQFLRQSCFELPPCRNVYLSGFTALDSPRSTVTQDEGTSADQHSFGSKSQTLSMSPFSIEELDTFTKPFFAGFLHSEEYPFVAIKYKIPLLSKSVSYSNTRPYWWLRCNFDCWVTVVTPPVAFELGFSCVASLAINAELKRLFGTISSLSALSSVW